MYELPAPEQTQRELREFFEAYGKIPLQMRSRLSELPSIWCDARRTGLYPYAPLIPGARRRRTGKPDAPIACHRAAAEAACGDVADGDVADGGFSSPSDDDDGDYEDEGATRGRMAKAARRSNADKPGTTIVHHRADGADDGCSSPSHDDDDDYEATGLMRTCKAKAARRRRARAAGVKQRGGVRGPGL